MNSERLPVEVIQRGDDEKEIVNSRQLRVRRVWRIDGIKHRYRDDRYHGARSLQQEGVSMSFDC